MRSTISFILVFGLLGCGDALLDGAKDADETSDATIADGTVEQDATADADPRDATSDDGNSDATVPDANTPDATSPDADLPDATPDATPDADVPDANIPDGPGIPGAHPDIVRIVDVRGRNPGNNWHDSYSVGSQCYCATTFDHDIGSIRVPTPVGMRTVRQVCDAIGDGPGISGRPRYNDIQCGNGPANNAGDEDDCPGRVDIGREGCGHIGPMWDLSVVN